MEFIKGFKLPKEHGDRLFKLKQKTGVSTAELTRRAIIYFLDHVEPGPHDLGVVEKEQRTE